MPASNPTTESVPDVVVPVSPAYEERPHGMLDLRASHPIAEVVYRRRAQVGGRVRSIRVRPWGEVITLEAVIADDTAAITVAFLGRRSIAGIVPGAALTVEGMVGQRNAKLVIMNPAYDLRPVGPEPA